MDERIARLKSPQEARTFAKNASARGHLGLQAEALKRAHALQAIQDGYTSPAEQAIAMALYAYEDEQSRAKGRTFRATRTRQMIAKRGLLDAAERLVLNHRPSKGYEVLEEAGLKALSFEAIIVLHPGEFSEPALKAAQARLDGRPPPAGSPWDDVDADSTAAPVLDAEGQTFLQGFNDLTNRFHSIWLPRYRSTIRRIEKYVAEDRAEELLDLIWKKTNNDVSNAGQGILKHSTVDAMRSEFIQALRDIADDGQPLNFDRIAERFEGWKAEGRIDKVPRLLIARAFAGFHPHRYHTTVDAQSQGQMLDWFVQHAGFHLPRLEGWAHRAEALVRHLDRLDLFGGDDLVRNLFPWFVLEQMRGRSPVTNIKPGHTPRPASAFADLPAAQRIISLRHNQLQGILFGLLETEFGIGTVWTEYPTGTGGFADAYVRLANQRCHVYEIKVAETAIQVVRQAMGQLLEYSYRDGGLEPVKLFAVGEPALDVTTRQYLERLRADFRLDIGYLQIYLAEEAQSSKAM